MHLVPRLAAAAALISALAVPMLCAATAASGSSGPVDITPNPATAGTRTTFAGPTPGAAGTAIIFGHVDAAAVGPAVFYNLGRLRRGDLVYVTLASRHTGVFRVYAAEVYAKPAFPPAIYGATWWPTLRLITCGGQFDPATGHYLANIVVFAEYAGQRG